MKIGNCLFAIAVVAGSTVAMAGDNTVAVQNTVRGIVPTAINGVPYTGGFHSRDVVMIYDNSIGDVNGLFTSTGSVPRWNEFDDVQFVPVPAGYIGATDPTLGATGPFPGGNVLTSQFAVGFVYNGGNSAGNPLPNLQMVVRFFDTDMVNSADEPVNNPALFIGGFSLNFIALPAQTGNVAFLTALFDGPVPYYFPNGNVGVQYTFAQESVPGSQVFDIPAAVYTGCFAIGTQSTNGEGNVGPRTGGSAAIYMRDANGDGNFQQAEYRVFAQPTNANFYLQITGSCAVDFNGDGFPTGDDFDSYVEAFELGDAAADFNGDGFVTGDDFDAFVAAFEKGC